jgi:hypothetical protein
MYRFFIAKPNLTKERKASSLEFEPDARSRFERAVDVVAKNPPHASRRPRSSASRNDVDAP